MNAARSLLAAILILVVILLLGCVPGLQSAKPTPEGEAVPPPEQAESAKTQAPPGQAAEQPLPPPPPGYNPPPPPDRDKISEGGVDLRMKDEVNDAATRFVKEMPNIKYAKSCYSNEYGGEGGWYLMLYFPEKKKMMMQQYSWNRKLKEWEVSGAPFEIPAKQLDFHLKGELAGEKCFRVK